MTQTHVLIYIYYVLLFAWSVCVEGNGALIECNSHAVAGWDVSRTSRQTNKECVFFVGVQFSQGGGASSRMGQMRDGLVLVLSQMTLRR